MRTLAPFVLSLLIPAAAMAANHPGTSSGAPAVVTLPGEVGGELQVTHLSQYLGTVEFTCLNADAAGTGAHILDRDNTGAGQEALRIDITDGDGTLLFTLSFSNVLGTFTGGIGDFFYTTPPARNPIRFVLTSLAGNGFEEQIDVDVEGTCEGLPGASVLEVPTLSSAGFAALLVTLGSLGVLALRRVRREH